MVNLNNPFEMERMQRETELREARENEWKRSRFGDGPFDQVTQVLIDEIMHLRERIRQLDSRTFMFQTF